MLVRVGTLTWGLLNENDTNEINADSTRSFVNTHCLCSVLKVEFLYSFSPTIGKQAFIVLTYRKSFILFLVMAKFKQACFAHDLSKEFQIFTAVHNSMFKIQQRRYFLLNPYFSAYFYYVLYVLSSDQIPFLLYVDAHIPNLLLLHEVLPQCLTTFHVETECQYTFH